MKLSSLSAFFPAFNEEANIARLVEEFYPVLAEVAERFEVIVVDDGSRDGTARVTEELARSRPGLRVVSHAVNRGYGGAVKTGDPVTLAKSQLPEGWGVLAMDKVKTDFTTSSWLTANPVVVEGETIEELKLFFCFQEVVPLKLHHALYGPPDGSAYAAVGSLKFATAEDARIGYDEMSREFYDIDKSVHARFGFDKADPKTVFYVYVPAGRLKDFEHFSKHFGSVAVEPAKK